MNNLITFPNPAQLEQRIRFLEENIEKLLAHPSTPKVETEWLTLEEFKDATGIKSYYFINKMKVVARQKNSKFKFKKLSKRLYIHQSEVQRFFDGFYES